MDIRDKIKNVHDFTELYACGSWPKSSENSIRVSAKLTIEKLADLLAKTTSIHKNDCDIINAASFHILIRSNFSLNKHPKKGNPNYSDNH